MKPRNFLAFIHPAGWPFIAIFAAVTFLLYFLGGFLFSIGLVLTAWCIYFFRDPTRLTPTRAGLVVSPADGKVVAIRETVPEPDLGLGSAPRIRISIFLNVFDVHVNRIPADGRVTAKYYRKGKFFNASLDKASVDNERMAVVLNLTGEHPCQGQMLGVVQIAGLIARRIICEAQEGSLYKTGERFGLIRFGSRTDVYLPEGVQPLVAVGQYMLGGETVLADFTSSETARIAETRE